MLERFDKAKYGFLAGLLLPPLGYTVGKYIIFPRGTWALYWEFFLQGGDDSNKIFTFCMLPTLFLFYFVFFVWKLEEASKGLVAVSLVFSAIFMAFKFL